MNYLYTFIWMRNQELKRKKRDMNKENKEKDISEKKEIKKEINNEDDIERLLLIM